MRIFTVICSYRQPPCSMLARWLKDNGVEWEVGSQEYGIDIARNQNVNRFLASGADCLLMIDGDTIPKGRDILESNEKLSWLAYVGHQGSRGHVDEFGAGACRIAANVFDNIPKPWFQTSYNGDLTKRIACECSTFAKKAKAAGYEPKCVGEAGHQQGGDTGVVLWPDSEATWPYQGRRD